MHLSYVQLLYSQCSHFLYEITIIPSQEGVYTAEGPFGSPIVLPSIHPHDSLSGSIGTAFLNDTAFAQEEAAHLGIHLNLSKSELIWDEPRNSSILQSVSDLIPTLPEHAVILGLLLVIIIRWMQRSSPNVKTLEFDTFPEA